MKLKSALATLTFQPGRMQESIDKLNGLLEPCRELRTTKLIRQATAECAARALHAWQAQGSEVSPAIVTAIACSNGFVRGDTSAEELLSAMEAARRLWLDAEPDSTAMGLAELAVGCGDPVPQCGVEDVLEGVSLMFSPSEASEYVLWYRDRLVELLEGAEEADESSEDDDLD